MGWDWEASVRVYGGELLGIVVGLFVRLGLAEDGSGTSGTVPRKVRLAVLEILRPAESAARRLIAMIALGIEVSAPVPRAGTRKDAAGSAAPDSGRLPAFALFDPRRRVAGAQQRRNRKPEPRIIDFDAGSFVAHASPSPALPDDPVDTGSLVRRLRALKAALEDVPKQAQRLARMMARLKAIPGMAKLRPMRPGRPPGHREKRRHPVDGILADCQYLALLAFAEPG